MMRIVSSSFLAAALASAVLAGGCGNSTPPTTQSVVSSGTNETAPPTTAPTTAPALSDKDMTHVLTMDEPYFIDAPNAGAAPAGILKAGTPVLLMVPGTPYCKIISNQGVTCYTLTSGLKPKSDK